MRILKSMCTNQHSTQLGTALISLPLIYHENGPPFSFAKLKCLSESVLKLTLSSIARPPWAQILLDMQSPGNLLPLGQGHCETFTIPTLTAVKEQLKSLDAPHLWLLYWEAGQKTWQKAAKGATKHVYRVYRCCNDKRLNFRNCRASNKLDSVWQCLTVSQHGLVDSAGFSWDESFLDFFGTASWYARSYSGKGWFTWHRRENQWLMLSHQESKTLTLLTAAPSLWRFYGASARGTVGRLRNRLHKNFGFLMPVPLRLLWRQLLGWVVWRRVASYLW